MGNKDIEYEKNNIDENDIEYNLYSSEIVIPILPVKDAVLFPHAVMPLNIGRRKTLNLMAEYGNQESILGVLAQKDKNEEDPSPDGLYHIGTTAKILRSIKKSESNYLIVVQGSQKFLIKRFVQLEPFLMARVMLVEEDDTVDTEVSAPRWHIEQS